MSEYKVHRVGFVEYIPKSINCAAFDTDNDHPKVAFSREDGSIEIRDPINNWIVDYIIPGQTGRTVEQLAWCCGRLFSAGMSSEIVEWDLEELKPLYQQDSYGGPVWSLKFSHSKKLVAVGCEDGSVRLFDVHPKGVEYLKCLSKQEHRILALAWSFNDKTIVTGGFDCSMKLFNVKTGHSSVSMTTDDLKSGNTMVWSVHFLKDMTIVMGDSLGNTQFWDGNTGTLRQSFKSHLADVLAVAVAEDEQTVFSSGVDSKVVRFQLLVNENRWIQTKHVRVSRHDTRTLAICTKPYNCMVSAGIDPRFVVYSLNDFGAAKNQTRHPFLPLTGVCRLAVNGNVLMFREQKKLHLWMLKEKNEEGYTRPKKLFEIKSNGDDHLVNAVISRNGLYVAYSTVTKARVVKLSLKRKPAIEKLQVSLVPTTQMCFTHDEMYLLTTNNKKGLCIKNLETNKCEEILFEDRVSLPFTHMAVSDDDQYVSIVDSTSRVFLFSLVLKKYVALMPVVPGKILSIKFHPKSNNLFMCLSNKKVYEFNITEEKFMPWLHAVNKSNALRYVGFPNNQLYCVAFNPISPKEIFFHTREVLGKLIYGQDLEEENETLKRKRTDIKSVKHFVNMMFFDFNADGEMVVVERPTNNVMKLLPPPLFVKKFGC